MSLAQLPNRAELVNFGEALNDSHVVLQVGGDETIQKGPAKRQADHVIREVSKKRSLEMDEAKGNGNDSDEMEEMGDEDLRAQIEAQLVSATPIFDSKGLTSLHRVAESGGAGGGVVVARLLTACPALMDSVSQCAGEKESDPSNPATAYVGRTALHGAARNGHVAIVAQLLAVNPTSIEARTEEGFTALHCAARGGHAAIVTQLLTTNPALVDVRADNGDTVLHSAARGGDAKTVAQLLAVSPTLIDAVDLVNGWTALHYAAYEGHAAIVSQLLAANPTLVDARARDNGETAFHCAARGGHVAIMTHLMTVSPASIEARMNAKTQSESEAKWRSEMDGVKSVEDGDLRAQIRAQLRSEVPLPGGRAALCLAAESGLREVVARLLAVCPGLLDALHIAANNSAFDIESGPLHLAARNGHTAIVTQLMAVNPALIEARDREGMTALHEAARNGHAAIVAQVLAVNPALIEAKNDQGATVLHCAAEGGYAALLSLLLAAKPALADARDNDGRTVLHSAVASGHAATVAQVLAAMDPALIDATADDTTAFYDAAVGGHAAIVTQLLAVNPGLVHSGRSDIGFMCVIQNGHVEIATQLLVANPALAEACPWSGHTALHWVAMVSGSEALTAQLLAAKPSLIEARTNDGETALHWAAHYGQAERVAQLLAAKASIDARANDGKTVLHCAILRKHPEIVSQLLAANPALIEARMDDGTTVLDCALGHDDITAQLLAAHPALLDAMINDTDSWRALLNVIQMGHEEAVGRLLTMHPELVHQTSPELCGWTVFHLAAFYGRDKVMSRLLASVVSQPDLEQLLLRRSTARGGASGPGSTALHVVAIQSTDLAARTSIITQLLAACPGLIDVLDDDNQTCVHCAAWSHESTRALLLSLKPALVHVVDTFGNTILHSMLLSHDNFVGREVLQRVYQMNPPALHAVNCEGSTPFELAVYARNEVAIELLQWKLTFDEVMSARGARLNVASDCYRKYVPKFKSLMELQCGELSAVLLPDVMGTVFEYVGLGVLGKPLPPPVKQMPMEQLSQDQDRLKEEGVGDQRESTSASDDDTPRV